MCKLKVRAQSEQNSGLYRLTRPHKEYKNNVTSLRQSSYLWIINLYIKQCKGRSFISLVAFQTHISWASKYHSWLATTSCRLHKLAAGVKTLLAVGYFLVLHFFSGLAATAWLAAVVPAAVWPAAVVPVAVMLLVSYLCSVGLCCGYCVLR